MTTWQPSIGRAWWRDNGHVRYPIEQFTSLQVQGGKYLTGTATVTARYSAAWVQAFFNAGVDPLGQAIEVEFRDFTAPLFVGVPVKVTRGWDATASNGTVTITFEHIWQHVFRRTILQSADNANGKPNTAVQYADILGQRIMNDALGKTYANGGLFTSAPPYSTLGVDRGTAGQFTPWTIAVATIHSPQQSATSFTYEAQSGRNTLDTLIDVAERGDTAFTMTESPAGTFTFDTTATYQDSDLTTGVNAVILSELRGNVTAYTYDLDYTATANTWVIKGDGAGTGQTYAWYQDTSATSIGIWEDVGTLPGVTTANALTSFKDRLMAQHAEATTAVQVTLREDAGARSRFNADFAVRDKVSLYADTFGQTISATVVGYNLSVNASGEVSVAVTLNSQPRRLGLDAVDLQRLPGGRHGGGIYINKDG